jgi:hypothetical protein
MNVNDRILYIGISQGTWIPNRVYRWLDSGWEMLEPPTEDDRQNANHYLEANGDVTEGVPDAVFSFAQIASIVYSSIFSKFMGAVDIELIEMEINGKKRVGEIRSSNFVSQADATPQKPAAGFRIRYNGDCEFNNGNFRGHIEADSGSFSGELKGATGTFSGNLSAAGGTFKGILDTVIINALTMNVNGRHYSGINHIINQDNRIIHINDNMAGHSISTPASELIPAKILRIAGNGECAVRVYFGNRNANQVSVQLYANGKCISNATVTSNGSYIWNNVVLDRKSNLLELMVTVYGGYCIINDFQALCRDDPGILAYMS